VPAGREVPTSRVAGTARQVPWIGLLRLDSGAPGTLCGIAAAADASGNPLIYFNDDNGAAVLLLSLGTSGMGPTPYRAH